MPQRRFALPVAAEFLRKAILQFQVFPHPDIPTFAVNSGAGQSNGVAAGGQIGEAETFHERGGCGANQFALTVSQLNVDLGRRAHLLARGERTCWKKIESTEKGARPSSEGQKVCVSRIHIGKTSAR